MSETPNNEIRITLPNKKELVFESGHSLKHWTENLRREWAWLEATPAKQIWYTIQGRIQNTLSQVSNWERNPHHLETIRNTKATAESAIRQIYEETKGVLWDDAALAAIREAKEIGSDLAAGLLISLAGGKVQLSEPSSESFFTGLIRGFLLKNEIDWAASAHRVAIQALETQARDCLIQQEERLKHLESENCRLNQIHQDSLQARDKALVELQSNKEKALNDLHSSQDQAYAKLTAEYEQKFQAIKKLYTDELALRAPVDYWEKSRRGHVKLAKRYALASGILVSVFGTALGILIHWAFGSLGQNENPKHWEVGVVVVSTFFVVWIIRLIIRLFLSHQHLATDAEQKVTMVNTFLALGKEEGGVAKEDRTIILQQLFKSAADGIVKEDGTPPGWLEYLSRSSK
ncbi:MAG: DUF6161 domain-containing protein [Verrucomicrobiota bacterium]